MRTLTNRAKLIAAGAIGATSLAILAVMAPALAGPEPSGRPSLAALIANAESAGPDGISKASTVVDWPTKMGGEMPILRKGTNGWTCMPDRPDTPANDPMCMDDVWMEWMHAGMEGRQANIDRVGLAYMLQGGWAADQADPSHTKSPPGKSPYVVGPHVMFIEPNPDMLKGISRDPYNGGPFVEALDRDHPIILMPVSAPKTTIQSHPGSSVGFAK